MNPPFETDVNARARLDDYFTATVVGLPEEVSLGKSFTTRMLRTDKYVTVDAITAKAWLSDPAHLLLKQQIKQPKHALGQPFKSGSFSRSRRWGRDSMLAFAAGFAACLVLLAVVMMQPWLRLPFSF